MAKKLVMKPWLREMHNIIFFVMFMLLVIFGLWIVVMSGFQPCGQSFDFAEAWALFSSWFI